MRRAFIRAAVMLSLAVTAFAAARATEFTYALPDDAEDFTLPPGPGMDLTAANCAACHSLDYIRTQPPGKGVQFWKDEVHKMVVVYGAQIEPADADAITAYLATNYGGIKP